MPILFQSKALSSYNNTKENPKKLFGSYLKEQGLPDLVSSFLMSLMLSAVVVMDWQTHQQSELSTNC
jgi:hypothetical protein